MSEVHRYNVVKMLSAEGNAISYSPHGQEVVMAAAYDALRQQLADVSNERDECKSQRDFWFKSHGKTAAELKASEARNAELEGLLKMFVENSDDHDVIELSLHALAQSAPATDEQGAGS